MLNKKQGLVKPTSSCKLCFENICSNRSCKDLQTSNTPFSRINKIKNMYSEPRRSDLCLKNKSITGSQQVIYGNCNTCLCEVNEENAKLNNYSKMEKEILHLNPRSPDCILNERLIYPGNNISKPLQEAEGQLHQSIKNLTKSVVNLNGILRPKGINNRNLLLDSKPSKDDNSLSNEIEFDSFLRELLEIDHDLDLDNDKLERDKSVKSKENRSPIENSPSNYKVNNLSPCESNNETISKGFQLSEEETYIRFDRKGWICAVCCNFNFEGRNLIKQYLGRVKCNRCKRLKTSKKRFLKKPNVQSNVTINYSTYQQDWATPISYPLNYSDSNSGPSYSSYSLQSSYNYSYFANLNFYRDNNPSYGNALASQTQQKLVFNPYYSGVLSYSLGLNSAFLTNY